MVRIRTETTSTAITGPEAVDISWFQKLGSPIANWLKKPLINAGSFLGKIAQGGKALIESLRKGNFGAIFRQWAKEDPLSAGAGAIATGLAAGTLLIVGGAVVGWVVGGVGAAVAGLGGLGGLAAGASLGGLASGILTTAETLYEFDLQISDKQIKADIKAAIDNLYGPAGQFVGQQLATMAVGGFVSPPKVQVNITSMRLMWQLKPELRQQLLQNVSNFAYQGIQTALLIGIKYAFMQGRRGIKKLWARAPDVVKKMIPGIDKAIRTWGDEDQESWSLSDGVNSQIEKIPDKRIRAAAEGFVSGLWQGFSQSVEIVAT